MQATTYKKQTYLDKEVSSIFKRIKRKQQVPNLKVAVSYSDLFNNKMLIIYLIREGIPYSLFDLISMNTPFSEKDWADILDISTKSLLRYKQNDTTFKLTQSEKIMEMAEVTDLGLEVFGAMDKFKSWLDTPNFALGNVKPVELLKDSFGKELVVGELTRINYGILA
jgi:putative toxin-antitoxin system antitoxin component (TIGR02293 family)